MIVEPKDPLDAGPVNLSARFPDDVKRELLEISEKTGRSLNAVVNQFAKWALKHDPVPRKPDSTKLPNTSLRMGKPLIDKLKKSAKAKNMTLSEYLVEACRLGAKEESK